MADNISQNKKKPARLILRLTLDENGNKYALEAEISLETLDMLTSDGMQQVFGEVARDCWRKIQQKKDQTRPAKDPGLPDPRAL